MTDEAHLWHLVLQDHQEGSHHETLVCGLVGAQIGVPVL